MNGLDALIAVYCLDKFKIQSFLEIAVTLDKDCAEYELLQVLIDSLLNKSSEVSPAKNGKNCKDETSENKVLSDWGASDYLHNVDKEMIPEENISNDSYDSNDWPEIFDNITPEKNITTDSYDSGKWPNICKDKTPENSSLTNYSEFNDWHYTDKDITPEKHIHNDFFVSENRDNIHENIPFIENISTNSSNFNDWVDDHNNKTHEKRNSRYCSDYKDWHNVNQDITPGKNTSTYSRVSYDWQHISQWQRSKSRQKISDNRKSSKIDLDSTVRVGHIPTMEKEYFSNILNKKLQNIAKENRCQISIEPSPHWTNIYELEIKGPEGKLDMVSNKVQNIIDGKRIHKTEWISKYSKLGSLLMLDKYKKDIKQWQEENECLLKTIENYKDIR